MLFLVIHHLLDLRHTGFLVQAADCTAHSISFLLEDHKADESLSVHQRASHELVQVLQSSNG